MRVKGYMWKDQSSIRNALGHLHAMICMPSYMSQVPKLKLYFRIKTWLQLCPWTHDRSTCLEKVDRFGHVRKHVLCRDSSQTITAWKLREIQRPEPHSHLRIVNHRLEKARALKQSMSLQTACVQKTSVTESLTKHQNRLV